MFTLSSKSSQLKGSGLFVHVVSGTCPACPLYGLPSLIAVFLSLDADRDACLRSLPFVETLPVFDNAPAANALLQPATYCFTCSISSAVASGGALNSTFPEFLFCLSSSGFFIQVTDVISSLYPLGSYYTTGLFRQ